MSRPTITWDTVVTAANTDEQLLETTESNGVITITKALETFGLTSFPLTSSSATKSLLSQVDFGPIRRWLSLCEEDVAHAKCVASPIDWQYLPGTRFKVIDLDRGCVIEAPEKCSFVALSYVWGGVDQIQLNRATAPLLMRDKGLDIAWAKLSATIRDAVHVCKQLGERYLWVDALCIVQDVGPDMKLQILRMRQIYSAAKLTIVAASAATADSRLLEGSSPEMTQVEISTNPKNSSLGTLLDISPWDTRAWCYQEKVLSHRLMLFTSNGIYLQCQRGTYDAKGTIVTDGESQNSVNYNAVGGMLSISLGDDLASYLSAVEHYSQRQLTKGEDKMNAFQGILRRYGDKLDGTKSTFVYGLPTCAFDQTFCWHTHQHNPHLRNEAFPSWSWLGWSDAVTFDRELLEKGHTNYIIYRPDRVTEGQEGPDIFPKPASSFYNRFGFPAATSNSFDSQPRRHIDGSISDLCIASEAIEFKDSNGRYAVFPSNCSQQEAPPSPVEMISILDLTYRPMPKPNIMDAETEAAPSIPAIEQVAKPRDFAEHQDHVDCEAYTPWGYIWLDRSWRERQPEYCVRNFLALTMREDPEKKGGHVITMLMCLQRMAKNGHFWAWERVQVMDCEVEEERWLRNGAATKPLVLA